jgi:hypothetical protein
MNKKPNFDAAIAAFAAPQYTFMNEFAEYSPAYVVTNEDLRWVRGAGELKDRDVLTVASSGDAPIFYKLGGARTVDSFDLSYCARVITDVKTAAIPKLSNPQYRDMLFNLYKSKYPFYIVDEYGLCPNMPIESAEFLLNTRGTPIFDNGMHPRDYAKYLPTDTEYSDMKQIIREPFNFIWSGIDKLHNELTRSYDIMNFSNIFQYIDKPSDITKIVQSLRDNLNDGGIIVLHTTWFFRGWELKNYAVVQNNLAEWARIGTISKQNQAAMILQKIK